jgi:hypothetical protein
MGLVVVTISNDHLVYRPTKVRENYTSSNA